MKSIQSIIKLAFFLVISFSYAQKAGETYYIQSAIAGKYLDVQWAKNKNGTPLHLWPYNGKIAQKFTLENAGDGYFYIKSALGKYVHVYKGTGVPKEIVTLWDKVNQNNLKWKFIKGPDGYFYIKSKIGTFLDVQWGKSKDGTPIWMWELNGGNAQKWRLKRLKPEPTLKQVLAGKVEVFKKSIKANPIKDLCPSTLVGGDFEFAGNGPKVFGSVFLYPSKNNKELIARIRFNAQETKSDGLTGRSEVKGYWEIPIYKAPYGTYINGIVDKPFSETTFNKVLQGGGQNQIFGGGDGSPHSLSVGNGLDNKGHVALLEVVGDTGGWDISTDNNCKDDTRILQILFNPIEIELIKKQ